MIIIYFTLCLLMFYAYKKTNIIATFIAAIVSMILIMNNFELFGSINIFINNFILILINKYFLYLILILSIISIIFDLSTLLGNNNFIDKHLSTMTGIKKNISLFLLSFFATNFDLSNTSVDKRNKNFKFNSLIIPFINIVSVPFLFLLFTIFYTSKITLAVIIIGLLLNGFTLWWIIRKLILTTYHTDIDYDIKDSNIYRDIIPHINIKTINHSVITKTKKFNLFYSVGCLLLSVFIFNFFIAFNILNVSLIFVLYILLYFIIKAEIYAYKFRLISEESIINTLINSIYKLLHLLFELILTILFSFLSYSFLETLLNVKSLSISFLFLTIILTVIVSLLFKNFKFICALAVPFIALFINYSDHTTLQVILIISMFSSLIAYMQWITLIDLSNISILKILDIIFGALIIIGLVIILIFDLSILYFFGFLLVQIILALIFFKVLKGKNV